MKFTSKRTGRTSWYSNGDQEFTSAFIEVCTADSPALSLTRPFAAGYFVNPQGLEHMPGLAEYLASRTVSRREYAAELSRIYPELEEIEEEAVTAGDAHA